LLNSLHKVFSCTLFVSILYSEQPNIFFPPSTGVKEEELGIPISPLCDRGTVKRADSQIGFLQFVIRPTYVLLGEILPRVKEEVMPMIDENINYWTREKNRLSMMRGTTGALAGMARKSSNPGTKRSTIMEREDE